MRFARTDRTTTSTYRMPARPSPGIDLSHSAARSAGDRDINPQRIERRQFLSWVLGAGALTATGGALAGCGSGSRNIVLNGSGSSAGETVSAATRQAAFDAVSALLDSLPGAGTAAETAQIAALLTGRAEFEETGVSEDGCAWGRFKDGRLLVVANNRPAPTSTAAAESRAARAATVRALSTSAKHRAAGTGLPASTSVRFFEAMGTVFTRPAAGLQSAVVAAPAHGYTGVVGTGDVPTGTVEELKTVQGSDGIFYLDAHGGTGLLRQNINLAKETGRKVFAIWTGTKASALDEPAYKADLDNDRLCYMIATNDLKDGKASSSTHYAITEAFVAAYMKFGANSLVYIDACSSSADTQQSRNFKGACFAVGAGVYVGWSEPVNDRDATLAAQFAFDRLLGNNTVAPVDAPAKPPLDWTALQSAMATTMKPGSTLNYDTSTALPGYGEAKLQFTAGTSGDLGVLVPSITDIAVDTAAQTITLTGIFGAVKGTAQSNVSDTSPSGSPVHVQTWTSTQVVLTLPSDCQTVRVLVDNRASNTVACVSTASLALSLSAYYVPSRAGALSVQDKLSFGAPTNQNLRYKWEIGSVNLGQLTATYQGGALVGSTLETSASTVYFAALATAPDGQTETLKVTITQVDPQTGKTTPVTVLTGQILIDVGSGCQVSITASSFAVSDLKIPDAIHYIPQTFRNILADEAGHAYVATYGGQGYIDFFYPVLRSGNVPIKTGDSLTFDSGNDNTTTSAVLEFGREDTSKTSFSFTNVRGSGKVVDVSHNSSGDVTALKYTATLSCTNPDTGDSCTVVIVARI